MHSHNLLSLGLARFNKNKQRISSKFSKENYLFLVSVSGNLSNSITFLVVGFTVNFPNLKYFKNFQKLFQRNYNCSIKNSCQNYKVLKSTIHKQNLETLLIIFDFSNTDFHCISNPKLL